jgi:tRNA 2-selenouridine synthase
MVQTLDTIEIADLRRFDDVIDVRSPGEFALDHLPGAINLPVLSNKERAEVGTLYVQTSRFLARRLGAAYVARNIARHLESTLSDRTGGYAPLVHCWRGGQRSNAMATVLEQVGWRTSVLAGGYRTWRRHVTATLYDADPTLRLVLLDGGTGSAKTEILGRLAARGVQTLDLERLAGHRGSVFGGFAAAPQPSQKMFESQLLVAMAELDPARIVVVEAESSKIGDRMTPPALWRAMQDAPRIELRAPAEARADYLLVAYRDIITDPASLERALTRLPPIHGRARLAQWRDMAQAGDHQALALALIETHYDPAYRRAARRHERPLLAAIDTTLDEASQNAAADEIARQVLAL